MPVFSGREPTFEPRQRRRGFSASDRFVVQSPRPIAAGKISARGRERRGEDFDELEWFAIRAIAHAGLDSVPALCDFYGLDERLVELVVGALQSAGHLDRGGDGRLALTGLGRESLGDRAPHQVGEARPWQRERSLESRLGF